MQLKLSIKDGDTITIDVQPLDTFQDLTARLYKLGNVQVDLHQLRSSNNDKPFDMTTNVMEYFSNSTQKEDITVESRFKSRLCRLCSDPILHNPLFLFETKENELMLADKVNESLPIHVSVKDALPKQICPNCEVFVNKSYDFMRRVVDTQKTLEKIYEPETGEIKPNGCCPLCSSGNLKNLHKKVTTGVTLPKKEFLKKDVTVSVPKNIARKENLAKSLDLGNVDLQDLDDEVVQGFWDHSPSQPSYSHSGPRKYKKRKQDDTDWTIDEEYVTVHRRGRPKGTKNKPKITAPIVEKSCELCGWIGADTDVFAHAINQHCQPDLEHFPCPLCKTTHANEMILEAHINRHNMATHKNMVKVKI